ncbi:class I SAM-dependent methyltransferase [Micromonospora peucetia]|uniref:Class I SAM-dependent methyltransferase n=1 Tax=Micromonospora peucetia TaxID=47871 RepID=A0A1C6V0Q5_9ACTN|nr:class I SAM-dependent methyltransferase [Micromonospora peucetia]MCX4388962.1 class I SAM-dependent methyltransferase [Micromonospora peucetia]WSA35172.1 class I SAM-dependent methyltransferase [Micromonospora peucetia]SCL59885.1 Methyltransferase domain-containing protein [Micromonospora peucetia]
MSAAHDGVGGPAARRRFATLGRSVALFQAFLVEQTDPDRFYGLLADDSVRQVSGYVPLAGRTVLDVGGGPGYFAAAFRAAGARYVGLDPDVGDFSAAGDSVAGMLRGSGTALPVRSGGVDVTFSSNVLEHVSEPTRMLDEMVRVTRPGGVLFVSFTPWLSPWGGHETAPWHYLGGDRARRRYQRRNGRPPKNRFRETLFPTSIAQTLRWARGNAEVELLDALPRYHPWWARWVIRLPGIREVVAWNFLLVLRRAGAEPDGAAEKTELTGGRVAM